MSGRARRLVPVIVAALATAAPAMAQTPAPAGIEQRLPDAAWLGGTAGPATAVADAETLVDPLLPLGEPRRADAAKRLRAAGLVGGAQMTVPGTAPAGRGTLRAWAAQFATPGGARAGADRMRWAMRVRTGTAGLTSVELADPADGRLVTATAADGTVRVAALFAVGTWAYGVERAVPPGAGDPDAAGIVSVATRLAARQPERPDPAGAQPLGVTDALRAALAAARTPPRPTAPAPALPLPGTTQAATHAGLGWAMARFAGAAGGPVLFVRRTDGTWRAVGTPGGPGCPRIPAPVKEVWGLGAECPLSVSAVTRPDDPDALALDDSPFAGLGTWVWEVRSSGGAPAIARRAVTNGIRTVFLKSGDGLRYWRQFDAALPVLKAAGLRVCAWQYVYGTRPVREARVLATAARRGADCVVVDAESEFERTRRYDGPTARAARRYMAELRRVVGTDYPVGLTSFAYVDGHGRFPYSAFLEGVNGADVTMPQIYWGAFRTAVDRAVARTAKWNSIYDVPIAPIAGTYERETPPDLRRFRCLAAAYGWQGASYWSFQHTAARQWPALARPITACTTPAALATTYPTLRMGARGDAVVWLQARLRTWGVPVARTGLYRAQTRAAVRAFQRARGLQADGVAGPLTWAVLLEQPG
jgi:hypothetical protein